MPAITVKDSTVVRGAQDHIRGTDFRAGRTVVLYVNGNYAGVQPIGPFDNITYGSARGEFVLPSGTPTGARVLHAQDNTDPTLKATANLTVT